MKVKPFEYVLGDNPMVPADHTNNYDWIVRLIDPVMIVGAMPGEHKIDDKVHAVFFYGQKAFTLFIHHYYDASLENMNDLEPLEVERQFKKAWNWYQAYLNFEDNAFDEIDSTFNN